MLKRPDLSGWPERREAADQLGISIATLDRWIHDGKIKTAHRPRNGHKPAVVCNPADIERLKPPPTPTPAYLVRSEPPPPLVPAPVKHSQQTERALQLIQLGQQMPAFITLEAFSERTGLSVKALRKLIKEEKLPAIRDGRQWKVHPFAIYPLFRELRAL